MRPSDHIESTSPHARIADQRFLHRARQLAVMQRSVAMMSDGLRCTMSQLVCHGTIIERDTLAVLQLHLSSVDPEAVLSVVGSRAAGLAVRGMSDDNLVLWSRHPLSSDDDDDGAAASDCVQGMIARFQVALQDIACALGMSLTIHTAAGSPHALCSGYLTRGPDSQPTTHDAGSVQKLSVVLARPGRIVTAVLHADTLKQFFAVNDMSIRPFLFALHCLLLELNVPKAEMHFTALLWSGIAFARHHTFITKSREPEPGQLYFAFLQYFRAKGFYDPKRVDLDPMHSCGLVRRETPSMQSVWVVWCPSTCGAMENRHNLARSCFHSHLFRERLEVVYEYLCRTLFPWHRDHALHEVGVNALRRGQPSQIDPDGASGLVPDDSAQLVQSISGASRTSPDACRPNQSADFASSMFPNLLRPHQSSP